MNLKKGIIKSSLSISFAIITTMSTIAGLWGYTIRDINSELKWWQCGLIILIFYLAFSFILLIVESFLNHKGYNTEINGKKVCVKTGNIFNESGLKIIPFNENFDTTVDDVIISHGSLNGQLIDNYVNDKEDLDKTIQNVKEKVLGKKNKSFELGKIIAYKDYLLLALSHFDNNNRAYINGGEYEKMLINMWNEIRITYAGKHIVLPLIGSGITTIEGIGYKNYTSLLKCILCTLRASKFQPDKGVTIILTKEMIKQIDMNKIKEEF